MEPLTFTPTRAAALDRLSAFAPRAGGAYARDRNLDRPGHPHVSTLSPWLRHRAITEAEVCSAVLDRHRPDAASKFLQEVLWRTYWKGWLERRPGVWTDYLHGVARARDRLATESGLRRQWEGACEGRTGIAPFDDWAQALARDNYLHNIARMSFASIWIHTLRLPWELGADFFLRHLLDGDPASNTLSWRWVAGLQTRDKTYAATGEKIAHVTDGRYDAASVDAQLTPEGEVRAVDGAAPPDPGPMPEDMALPRTGRIGLLLHEDDLHPDYLLTRGLEPDGTAALLASDGRSSLAVAPAVGAFGRALAEDAVAAMPGPGPVTDAPSEIAAWAQGFDHVVAPYAPIGPLRTRLDACGVDTIRPMREWDGTAWPHATRGYFRFRTAMETILAAGAADTGR